MKWWGWILVILLVLWVAHHSAVAAADARSIGQFVNNLTG